MERSDSAKPEESYLDGVCDQNHVSVVAILTAIDTEHIYLVSAWQLHWNWLAHVYTSATMISLVCVVSYVHRTVPELTID